MQARAVLMCLYDQERNAYNSFYDLNAGQSNLDQIRASRGVAERRYINCIIAYMRATGRMTRAQAGELQKYFTRERMRGMAAQYEGYMLGMFPPELL